MISHQELTNKRYDALLRENENIGLIWAQGQIAAHRLLIALGELGWSREDQLLALQEMHRSTWIQVDQFEQMENL